MDLNDSGLLSQGRACVELSKANPSDFVCSRYGVRLEEATGGFRGLLADVETAYGKWLAETDESSEAYDELRSRAMLWWGMLMVEKPELARTGVKGAPRNKIEVIMLGDAVADVLDDYGDELDFQQEGLEEIQGLLNKCRKEEGEAQEAEETYHLLVAEKRAARKRLEMLIRAFKVGIRRTFGVRSRQYQSIKSVAFGRKGDSAAEDAPGGASEE